MSSQQLLAFLLSRPFVPFVATLIGGRRFEARHPEFAMPAFAGLGMWLIHEDGRVEAIAGEAIASIASVSPTDPSSLTG
jgi:hypothetical protein